MMSNMEYKGYLASIEFDTYDNIFVGEVLGIEDSLTFQGSSVEELQKMFSQRIADYLEICQRTGRIFMEGERCEQETIVNYDAEYPMATVYTRDRAVMHDLDRCTLNSPNTHRLIKQDEVSKTYEIPKSCICYCTSVEDFAVSENAPS